MGFSGLFCEEFRAWAHTPRNLGVFKWGREGLGFDIWFVRVEELP